MNTCMPSDGYSPGCVSIESWGLAAVAAKLLQSCLTLCDPRDDNPPGSPIPGILQARTLEWVAISFSNAWKWKVKVKSLSRVRLLATPWTAASFLIRFKGLLGIKYYPCLWYEPRFQNGRATESNPHSLWRHEDFQSRQHFWNIIRKEENNQIVSISYVFLIFYR